MKTLFGLIALATFAICHGSDYDIPHIVVYGTAIIQAPPDELRWSISVTTKGLNIAEVADKHDKLVSEAITFLKKRQIPKKEVQTSNLRLTENWEYRGSSRVLEGYYANTDIAFKSSDLSDYRNLWIGLSKLAGVSVNSAAWDTSERIELQNSTRIQALQDAKKKAQTLAESLDARIAEPLQIEEVTGDWQSLQYVGNSVRAMEGSAEGGEAMSPGTIEIKMRVRTVFRLQTE
jgi:uncharacterized protein YggE